MKPLNRGHHARPYMFLGVAAASLIALAGVFFDNYIDRVALACVNQLTPKWSTTLAACDVYIWDQCFAMEQSLRID